MTKKSKGGLWIFVFAAGATLSWVGFPRLGSHPVVLHKDSVAHRTATPSPLNEIGDFSQEA